MKKNFTKQDFYALLKPGGPNGDCLEWTGHKSKSGYGRTFYNGKKWRTHRLAIELEGISTDGWYVLHSCDNPLCCNPTHLRLGNHTDNMKDRSKRGRTKGANKGSAHYNATLTDDQVMEIRTRLLYGQKQKDIALDYGISQSAVSKIKNNQKWKHIP